MPEDVATQGNGETPRPEGTRGETPTFDTWIGEQDDDVRGLIDGHIQGLKSSLDSERDQRKSLAKELKQISGKLDANSDAAKEVETLRGRLEQESARAEFYEEATAAGCRNVRAAWLIASTDGLSVKQVQEMVPEFFSRPTPPSTNAGNGSGSPPSPARDMNAYIRRAAGKG